MGIAYSLGSAFGRLSTPGKLVVAALGAGLVAAPFVRPTAQPPKPKLQPAVSVAKAAPAPDERAVCRATIDSQRAEYAHAMSVRSYWIAATAIRKCAETLNDSALIAMVKDAEVKSLLADINDPKTAKRDKARAMEMLGRDYPDVGSKYAAQAKKLTAEADRQDGAAIARRLKSEGVHIGMSKEQVLASSWGKPQHVNRTTTAAGEREQWVYGQRNYLYFRGDTLTSIQN